MAQRIWGSWPIGPDTERQLGSRRKMISQTVQADGMQHRVEWVITQCLGGTDCCEGATGIQQAIVIGEGAGGGQVRAREHFVGVLESRRFCAYCPWLSFSDRETIKSQ